MRPPALCPDSTVLDKGRVYGLLKCCNALFFPGLRCALASEAFLAGGSPTGLQSTQRFALRRNAASEIARSRRQSRLIRFTTANHSSFTVSG